MISRGYNQWAAFGVFVAELDKELGWMCNVVYTGHSLTKKGASWLLVVRAIGSQGNVVTFLEAESPIQCFRLLWKYCHYGRIYWKKDTYAR